MFALGNPFWHSVFGVWFACHGVCVCVCVHVSLCRCASVSVCVGCCRQGLCKRLFYFQHFDSFLTPTAWNIRTLICDTRANIAQCIDACNNKLLTIFTQHATSGCPFSFNIYAPLRSGFIALTSRAQIIVNCNCRQIDTHSFMGGLLKTYYAIKEPTNKTQDPKKE